MNTTGALRFYHWYILLVVLSAWMFLIATSAEFERRLCLPSAELQKTMLYLDVKVFFSQNPDTSLIGDSDFSWISWKLFDSLHLNESLQIMP